MKALAKLERGPGLTLTRVKKPDVGHNDVMIRIRNTAICGTHIHIWKMARLGAEDDPRAHARRPPPMTAGSTLSISAAPTARYTSPIFITKSSATMKCRWIIQIVIEPVAESGAW